MKDRLIRSAAELDNVRKRGEREKQDVSRYAITKFSKDIIEVADTFERALAASPGEAAATDKSVGDFVEGVAMTERLLLTVLERHGIRRVEAKAQKFDPNVHQAVTELPNPDMPDGHVAEVFQTGYLIEDRVLRPAMVAVARGGAKMAKPAERCGPPPVGGQRRRQRPSGSGTDEASGGRTSATAAYPTRRSVRLIRPLKAAAAAKFPDRRGRCRGTPAGCRRRSRRHRRISAAAAALVPRRLGAADEKRRFVAERDGNDRG